MVYIRRDKKGKIEALFQMKTDEALEKADLSSPELLDFFYHSENKSKYGFIFSDLQLIRVLEDLIDILIEKNIISITDFPARVIDKILDRHRVRQHLMNTGGMEFYNEDDDVV